MLKVIPYLFVGVVSLFSSANANAGAGCYREFTAQEKICSAGFRWSPTSCECQCGTPDAQGGCKIGTTHYYYSNPATRTDSGIALSAPISGLSGAPVVKGASSSGGNTGAAVNRMLSGGK